MSISMAKGVLDTQADMIQTLLNGNLKDVDLTVKLAKTSAALNLKAQELGVAEKVMVMMGVGGNVNLKV